MRVRWLHADNFPKGYFLFSKRKIKSDLASFSIRNSYKLIMFLFCMGKEKQATLGGEKKPYSRAHDFQNVMDRQGGYGKLKAISKTRNLVICRKCKGEIPIGSACYMQSDYTGEGTFPVQTRVCVDCGEKLIRDGVGVKEGKGKKKGE